MNKVEKTLIFYHIRGFTGCITLSSREIKKQIIYKSGHPVFVKSSIRQETLGQILFNEGVINKEQYQESLDIMRESGKRQGEVLIELGYLSPYEVYEALRKQVKIKFRNAFLLDEAEINVEAGEQHLENITEYPIDAFRIIFEMVSFNIDLGHRPEASEETGFELTEEGRAYLSQQALNAQETRLVRCLDGKKTFGRLLNQQMPILTFVKTLSTRSMA